MSLPVSVIINSIAVVGHINPRVYGHFIEHLENCEFGK
jgi:alpha-L-arabinofuranosidase